jgi:hypothetical protein
MARSRALTQCRDIQNLAYETAIGFKTLEPSEDAIERHARKCVALAQIARAWESAVERTRILRGRPLPGPLRPEKRTKRKSRAPVQPLAIAPLSRVSETQAPVLKAEASS